MNTVLMPILPNPQHHQTLMTLCLYALDSVAGTDLDVLRIEDCDRLNEQVSALEAMSVRERLEATLSMLEKLVASYPG